MISLTFVFFFLIHVPCSLQFLREELQYRGGSYERRQQAFHQNDKYISVLDLWESWMHSEVWFFFFKYEFEWLHSVTVCIWQVLHFWKYPLQVRNWTVEQTVEWLRSFVDLPMYSQHFIENAIDGMSLPM